jgi:hypothetical protein
MTEVFFLHDAWHLLLDGTMVAAEFTCKGAAEAAIPVERERRLRNRHVTLRRLVFRLADQYSKTEDKDLQAWYYSGFLCADGLERVR